MKRAELKVGQTKLWIYVRQESMHTFSTPPKFKCDTQRRVWWIVSDAAHQPERWMAHTAPTENLFCRKIRNVVASQEWKICVPAEQRMELSGQELDDINAAHPGYHKMMRRMQLKYYWPHMSEFISNHVRNCESCRETILVIL